MSKDSKKRSISRRDFVRQGATAGLSGAAVVGLAARETDQGGSQEQWT